MWTVPFKSWRRLGHRCIWASGCDVGVAFRLGRRLLPSRCLLNLLCLSVSLALARRHCRGGRSRWSLVAHALPLSGLARDRPWTLDSTGLVRRPCVGNISSLELISLSPGRRPKVAASRGDRKFSARRRGRVLPRCGWRRVEQLLRRCHACCWMFFC